MKHLDLFSGIGGFALAARNVGWQTVGFCENEPFCQAVLRKHWPNVPIYDDARTLDGWTVGAVDVITGGYPCQPFSLAGKRRGKGDDRHLWPAFARLIRELRPSWIVGENVAGHISMGLDDVLSDLEGLGYAWEAFVIPAVAVDAKHRRDRVWIVAHPNRVAYANGEWQSQPSGSKPDEWRRVGDGSQDVSHANRKGFSDICGSEAKRGFLGDGTSGDGYFGDGERFCWSAEPRVGRVAHGVPRRVDRLRALGNAIVPQVAEVIFRAINAQSSED